MFLKIRINLRDIFPHPYTIANAEAFLSIVTEDDPKTVFAIANEVEAIGSIGLVLGKDVHRFTAELGYWLAEPYTTNTASARLLEKAGFKYVGLLQAGAFLINCYMRG